MAHNSKHDFPLLQFQFSPFIIFCKKTDFKRYNFSSVTFGSTRFLKHIKIAQYLYPSFCQKNISGKAQTADDYGEIAVRGAQGGTKA